MRHDGSLISKLNGSWHEYAVWGFMAIASAHVAEHVVQTVQIFALGWARPEARGLFGQWFPWLVTSETLHYFYAIFTLAGIALLLPGFKGRARLWWVVALLAQFWHHIEHVLLLFQRVAEEPFFGRQVPTSLIQLWFPRVELHLFYNAVVLVPLLVALGYHLFPSASELGAATCGCARRLLRRASAAAA